MTPRRRAAAVLALALAGGALGAAVARPVGAVGAALAAPAASPLSLPVSLPASVPMSRTSDGPVLAAPSSPSATALAPPTAASSTVAASPTPTEAPSAEPREGFARSLAITSADAAADQAAAAPVSVAVPRIGVDTPLVSLGIAADGSLEVPGRDEFDRAGWLTTSAVPGEVGASVIAGHVDSTTGPAVFFRLHELVPGDEVVVTRGDGSSVVFVVDAVESVSKDAFPTAEVYGPQPGPVLRLITCGGVFDHATGHYENNVIAFASLR